jgi:hypothetical protein
MVEEAFEVGVEVVFHNQGVFQVQEVYQVEVVILAVVVAYLTMECGC